jgi:hypothetical protein
MADGGNAESCTCEKSKAGDAPAAASSLETDFTTKK